MDRCDYCHEPLPDDATARRRFCKTSHRVLWHRAEERRRHDEAIALLFRSTRAAIAQDADELAAVDREAARIFGDSYTRRLSEGLKS